MTQQGLFKPRIEQDFLDFHRKNPQVYTALVGYGLQAKNAGFKNFGFRMCWERARWYFAMHPNPEAEFKLNNNHAAYYARLIMEQEPELAGFFEIRKLKSQEEE